MNTLSRGLVPLVIVLVLGAAVPPAAASGNGAPPVGTQFGEQTTNDTGLNGTVDAVESAGTSVSSGVDDGRTSDVVDREDGNDSTLRVVLDTSVDGSDSQDDVVTETDAVTEELEVADRPNATDSRGDDTPTHVPRVAFASTTVTVVRESGVPDSWPGLTGSEGTPDAPTDGLAIGAGIVLFAGIVRQLPGLVATQPVTIGVQHALDRGSRFVTLFRYSRYDDSDPLEHGTRETVYETIENEPGAYLSEVGEHAGVPLSTARHHVRVLERERLVASAKVRGKRRFYPSDTDGIETAAAMEDGPTAAVLDALARLGPCSVATLADELGRDPSTVTHHLQQLEDEGLVERERDGRAVVNRLAPPARRLLEPERCGPHEAMPADD